MDEELGFKTSREQRQDALKCFDTFTLPDKRYGDTVADYTKEAAELARVVRSQCVPRLGRLAVAEAIVDACGWRLNYRAVTKVGSQDASSLESLLIPLYEGNFAVVINTLHNPTNGRSAGLIAHEIAHSFFYNHAVKPPLRITVGLADADEEQFCNEFAYRLTDIRL